MPELPFEIWKERIANEIKILDNLKVIDTNSIAWRETSVDFWIEIKALGLRVKGNDYLIDLKPKRSHRIFIRLNRSFPYPGGIDFSWHSEIFHPNIHPVKIFNSETTGTGYICLNVLKQWSRLSDLESTVKSMQMLLKNPNPDDPLNYDICLDAANFFKKNTMDSIREKYNLKEEPEDFDDDGDEFVILED